jgi:hypothetical protein
MYYEHAKKQEIETFLVDQPKLTQLIAETNHKLGLLAISTVELPAFKWQAKRDKGVRMVTPKGIYVADVFLRENEGDDNDTKSFAIYSPNIDRSRIPRNMDREFGHTRISAKLSSLFTALKKVNEDITNTKYLHEHLKRQSRQLLGVVASKKHMPNRLKDAYDEFKLLNFALGVDTNLTISDTDRYKKIRQELEVEMRDATDKATNYHKFSDAMDILCPLEYGYYLAQGRGDGDQQLVLESEPQFIPDLEKYPDLKVATLMLREMEVASGKSFNYQHWDDLGIAKAYRGGRQIDHPVLLISKG